MQQKSASPKPPKRGKLSAAAGDYRLPDGALVPYPLTASKSALCSAWEGERVMDSGVGIGSSIGRVEAELSKAQDNPKTRPQQFEKARLWWNYQWFVRSVILFRYYFFTYGFQIKSEDGKISPRLKKWESSNRLMYRRYAREAWQEWLVLENVVGLWWRKGMHPPVVYPPERTKFEDLFGHETIEIRHGVTQEHITTIGAFSQSQVKEFASPEIKIDHNHPVFGFDVLRRERVGSGFGIPTIAPLFDTLAELLSLEVGHQQLAAACRMVMELHLMGHEIKAGLHAGSKAHFWNKARALAFEKGVKGKTGHLRLTANFDHQVKQAANWPDPKLFDANKFESGINRIALWAMPLGQMVLGKSANPYLLPMLKIQAIGEREYVAEHLRQVFIEALGAPDEIKPVWSNKCFADPRIAADLSKIALASGPLSQKSFLDEIGADQEEEWEFKSIEGSKGKKFTTPIYDAAHGPDDGKSKAGRKPGTKDGDGEP